MKIYSTIIAFALIILLFSQCNSGNDAATENNKNLRQNMSDMMIYHDNLGTELRQGSADDASWLLEGMDSSLQSIAAKFDKHRKLKIPFAKTYRNNLQPAIIDIRKSLEENDFPSAIIAYRLLTKNCNNCHKEHDVDEEVKDLSNPANN